MKRCITNLGATDPDYRLDKIAFMERKLAAFKYHHRKSFNHNFRDTGRYIRDNRCSILFAINLHTKSTIRKDFSYLARCLKADQDFKNLLLRGKYREL